MDRTANADVATKDLPSLGQFAVDITHLNMHSFVQDKDTENQSSTSSGSASQHLPKLNFDQNSESAKPDWSNPDSYNLNDLSAGQFMDLAKYKAGSVSTDALAFGSLGVRFQSEKIARDLVKNGSQFGRSEILTLAAIPLAGLSGYALYRDAQNFTASNKLTEKCFYATSSALDAGALGGTAMMIAPELRPLGVTVTALSITARAAVGFGHGVAKIFE
jgi:hypothetical protein